MNDGRNTTRIEAPALMPPVDVIEDASGITLYADLPGVPKDKLSVASTARASSSKARSRSRCRKTSRPRTSR